ncbi:hypothetical protein [Sphingomonas sp. PR090111-T3T-6A]|uniref:hypothetical protein n=1 Tax=Sphingomonas sp. PR090111-T3T-6A TaxID=685778 RepID=UPI00138AD3C8|nr:hypothetical protein [Sphingomonas sp. PR090111-T3T-6A]
MANKHPTDRLPMEGSNRGKRPKDQKRANVSDTMADNRIKPASSAPAKDGKAGHWTPFANRCSASRTPMTTRSSSSAAALR